MTDQIAIRFCSFVLLYLLSCSNTLLAQSDNPDTLLINREKVKWEALKTGTFGVHPEWFAIDFVSIGYMPDGSVYRTGIRKPQTPTTTQSKVKFPPATFLLSDFKVVTASPTVKVITYQADGPLNLYVTTVWSKLDNDWKSVFYQATKYK